MTSLASLLPYIDAPITFPRDPRRIEADLQKTLRPIHLRDGKRIDRNYDEFFSKCAAEVVGWDEVNRQRRRAPANGHFFEWCRKVGGHIIEREYARMRAEDRAKTLVRRRLREEERDGEWKVEQDRERERRQAARAAARRHGVEAVAAVLGRAA